MKPSNRELTPVRLERSTLFVPGANWHQIQKATTLNTDAICIDLEDSVAPDQKAASRVNVIRAVKELKFASRIKIFRINGIDTPYAYRDLIDVLEAAVDCVDLIMLPKVSSPDDVHFVSTLLDQLEMYSGAKNKIGIEAQIETAAGFVYLKEIAQASSRLEALIFGPGDYAASMGMPSTSIGESDEWDHLYPGHRWHAVMHAIVATARANHLRCIDGPFAGYQDATGFEKSCKIAKAMGFDGKQCIHPSQLEMTNATFSPSHSEVQHARNVIRQSDASSSKGVGASTLNGKMIDAASVRMAKVVLERYELMQARQGGEAPSGKG